MKTLHIHDVHIVLIQETVLPKLEIKNPGYTPTKCEYHNFKDTMTFIRNDIQSEVKNCPFDDMDVQDIDVWIGKEQYDISTVCQTKYQLLQETTYKKTIIADFNSHTPSWGYPIITKQVRT